MKERAFRVFSEVMDVPLESITEDSTAESIESWDSLQHMNLILALEEEFDVQFNDEHVMEMDSVNRMIEVLTTLTA